jgi:tetratricopeptide (TPR) repeat protein
VAKTCAECETENEDNAIFCQQCGTKISVDSSEPKSADSLNNEGIRFQEKEDYETALNIFQSAIKLDSNFAPPYFNIGVIYYNLSEYDNARIYFNKFKELAPPNLKSFVKEADRILSSIDKIQGIYLMVMTKK